MLFLVKLYPLFRLFTDRGNFLTKRTSVSSMLQNDAT